MKKFLSFAMVLCLVMGLCTVSALADGSGSCKEGCILAGNEHTVCIVPDKLRSSPGGGSTSSGTWGGIDWTLSADGTLTISPASSPASDPDCGKTYAPGVWREAVKYNSAGEGTAIIDPPYGKANVKSLIIKEGVTHIGSFSAQFPNLTGEVVIPSTVTYIGQEAFQKAGITKLTFASGGSGTLCIGPGAFKSIGITELVLPYDRPEVHIHCWAFNDCKNLKNVTLPANITTFSQWTHVEYMGMDYVNSGDSQVFARCNSLETLTFGSEEVKEKFFAAPYNSNNINAIGNVTVAVDPTAGIPNNPAAPAAPAAPVVENIYYVPATADNSNMALWSILALALLTTAFVTRRKKTEN